MKFIDVTTTDPIIFSFRKPVRTDYECLITSYTIVSLPAALTFEEGTGTDVQFTVNTGYDQTEATYYVTMRMNMEDGTF